MYLITLEIYTTLNINQYLIESKRTIETGLNIYGNQIDFDDWVKSEFIYSNKLLIEEKCYSKCSTENIKYLYNNELTLSIKDYSENNLIYESEFQYIK